MPLKNNILATPIFYNKEAHLFALILVVIYILFFNPYYPFVGSLGNIPNYLYCPNKFSIAYYLIPGLPSKAFLVFWDLFNTILLFVILVGSQRQKIISAVVLTISLTLCFSMVYSFGKIDHMYANVIFLPFACLALNEKNNWSINTIIFILLFTFFSSGIFKIYEWDYLSLSNHKVLSFIYQQWFHTMIEGWPAWLQSTFLEFLDYGAIFFEVGIVIFIFSKPKYINLLIIFACIFHCLNNLLLKIAFQGQHYIYLFLTLAIFYKEHSRAEIFLKKLEKLFNFQWFRISLLLFLIIRPWFYKNYTIPNILWNSTTYYSFYILVGIVNIYLLFLVIKRNKPKAQPVIVSEDEKDNLL